MEEPTEEVVTNQQESRWTKKQKETFNKIENFRSAYEGLKEEDHLNLDLTLDDVADVLLGAYGISQHSLSEIRIDNGHLILKLTKDQ